jgi:hypothetical protein
MVTDYELVYTMTDFWDRPRAGVANFRGSPHVYQSTYADTDEGHEDDPDVCLLMPIDPETLRLALEAWAIWQRWETAFHRGQTTLETHPALPEDRERHRELKPLLDRQLAVDPERAVRAVGEFRRREDPNWNGIGWPRLEVRWTLVDERRPPLSIH